jgi:cephalosporin hydroxylase
MARQQKIAKRPKPKTVLRLPDLEQSKNPEWGPGPMAAVNQLLKGDTGKDFEQDFTREVFLMTSYPGGWLRRKQAPTAR